MNRILAALAALLLASASLAGLITVSGPVLYTQASGGDTGSTQDWVTRSTQPGVVAAYSFDTSDEITSGYIAGANGTRGYRDTSIKFGDSSLRFDLLEGETGANISGSWTAQSAPWVFQDAFGEGETFYVQYRTRITASMKTNLSDWDSNWKQIILHRNNTTCASLELTITHPTSQGMMYTDCGARSMWTQTSGPTWEDSPPLLLQQDWDLENGGREANGYQSAYPNNAWYPPDDKWYTVLIRVHVGTLSATSAGPEDSTIEVWIAEDGETEYRKVIAVEMALQYDSSDSDAYNNLTLTPYMTSLSTTADEDASMWFDELIISTDHIAVPTPETPVPTWAAAQTESTWLAIAADATIHDARPNPLPAGTVPPLLSVETANVIAPWSGGAYDTDNKRLLIWGGGHGDYAGNEIYALPTHVESPGFIRLTDPSTASGGSTAIGTYGDGQPRSAHSQSTLAFVPGRGLIVVGISAMYSSGYSGNGIFRFDADAGEFTHIGTLPGTLTGPSGTMAEAWAHGSTAYDSVTDRIYYVAAGRNEVHVIHPDTGDVSVVTVTMNPQLYNSAAISPEHRIFIYRSNYSGARFRVYDIDNETASSPTINGTFPSRAPGLVWHAPSNAFIGWDGGATLYKLTATNWTSGPYTATVIENGEGGDTPTDASELGTYGRFQLVPGLYGDADGLIVVNEVNQAAYVYRLPVGGV